MSLVLAYENAAKGVIIVPQAMKTGNHIEEFRNYENFCNELEKEGWQKTMVEEEVE